MLKLDQCLPLGALLGREGDQLAGLLAASGTPQEVALDATVRSRYLGRGFQAEDIHA